MVGAVGLEPITRYFRSQTTLFDKAILFQFVR